MRRPVIRIPGGNDTEVFPVGKEVVSNPVRHLSLAVTTVSKVSGLNWDDLMGQSWAKLILPEFVVFTYSLAEPSLFRSTHTRRQLPVHGLQTEPRPSLLGDIECPMACIFDLERSR